MNAHGCRQGSIVDGCDVRLLRQSGTRCKQPGHGQVEHMSTGPVPDDGVNGYHSYLRGNSSQRSQTLYIRHLRP